MSDWEAEDRAFHRVFAALRAHVQAVDPRLREHTLSRLRAVESDDRLSSPDRLVLVRRLVRDAINLALHVGATVQDDRDATRAPTGADAAQAAEESDDGHSA